MKNLKIRLSPLADKDLTDIEKYISEELKNPEDAVDTILSIIEGYERLADFPKIGVNISKAIDVKTEIRMLVCGSHRIFYKADDYISVYRILNCRMSYINILFE